jgi:DNA polymerase III delta prime subunit
MDTFLENASAKAALKSFLENDNNSFLLLIGPSGGGKTTLCDLAIEEQSHKFQVLRPVYEEFNNHKAFIEFIKKFITVRNMLEIFEKKQKILFLDDVDTLLSQDRYANVYIQELINAEPKSTIKILMTCAAGEEKRVSDLKKLTKYARIYNPSVPCALQYMKSRYDIGRDDATINAFLKSMHCNIRNCVLNINMLHDAVDFEEEELHNLVYDKNICDSVSAILRVEDITMRQLDVALSKDPSLIAYIMFDNFYNYLGPDDKCRKIRNILSAYNIASKMETCIYGSNDWVLNDICNIYRCGILKANIKTTPNADVPLSYTTITTRASNHYNMIKRVGEHQSNIGVSYAAIQRYHEIESNAMVKSAKNGRKHKEDSAINNYLRKIFNGKRTSERRSVIKRRP